MRPAYWVIVGVLVVLCVVGLITYSSGSDDRQAQRKAEQLTQKFEDAGLAVPAKQEVFTRTLGTDGGAVCENPATALGKANLAARLVNGASFVGQRPVIADTDVLKGEALILETYCPDVLKEYQDKIDELKTDSVLKD
jgi:hypothetical protein